MRKRTAKAIMAAHRTIYKAIDILEREYSCIESYESGQLSDDILWTLQNLSQSLTDDGIGYWKNIAINSIDKKRKIKK